MTGLFLKKEVPDQALKTGDVGTVIHVHKKGVAFEVEFLTLQGETVAIATLEASQVRPFRERKSPTHVCCGIVTFWQNSRGLPLTS